MPRPKPFVLVLILLGVFHCLPQRAIAQANACPNRLVPFYLAAPDGSFPTQPKLADVEIKSHAHDVQAISLQPETRPRRIVILIDIGEVRSGEASDKYWAIAMQFVRQLTRISNAKLRFALVLYSDRVVETIDFSKGLGAVDERLQNLPNDPILAKQPLAGHAFVDALQAGYALLQNATSADSILIMTSGVSAGNKLQPGKFTDELKASSTRVFVILLGPQIVSRAHNLAEILQPPGVAGFSMATGGVWVGPFMIDKFGAILVLNDSRLPIPIAKQMSDFYAGMLNNMVIEVQQTAVSNKPTELEIVFSHEGRPKWKDPLLLYPRQIGPCLGSSQP